MISDIDVEWRDGGGGWLSHNGLQTDISYSPRGDMLSIDVGRTRQDVYRYDQRDRLSEIERNGHINKLEYGGHRLVASKNELGAFFYQYDAAGNRVSETRTSDNDVQSGVSYTYAKDERAGAGNRLLATTDQFTGAVQRRQYSPGGEPVDDGVRRYIYNSERRPIEVYLGDFLLAEYQYNALGERVKKVVYDVAGRQESTYFFCDDAQLSAEMDIERDVLKQYLYVESFRPVVLLEGDDVLVIHTDHLGVPHNVTDNNAKSVWEALYEPFGKAVVTQEALTLPLRLPGQYFDAETGTHYNYFRDYDPNTGRYLTADPIGLNGGLHHYAYANGLPQNEIDPLGLRGRPIRNYTQPTIGSVLARLNYRQLYESIQIREPTFVHSVARPIRSPVNERDVIQLAMILQSYELRDSIRQFDSAFTFSPTGMPQQVNELARRLDAMVYIEQIRQTQDPNYSYPSNNYSENDLLVLRDSAVSSANECTAFYDADFSNHYDAQLLADYIGDGIASDLLALDPNGDWYVPFSTADELACNDYTSNGGTLSRTDWEFAGKPDDGAIDQTNLTRHKADRWQEYLNRSGQWPYSRWSKVYELYQTRALDVRAIEEAYHRHIEGGKTQLTIKDIGPENLTRRLEIVDVDAKRGVEVKSGYTTHNAEVRSELERDAQWVTNDWEIHWHFDGTPSRLLLRALEAAGITWSVRDPESIRDR